MKEIIKEFKKKALKVSLKSFGLCSVSTIFTTTLAVVVGVPGAAGVFAFINVMFVHFGYTRPTLLALGEEYKKKLEDKVRKDL